MNKIASYRKMIEPQCSQGAFAFYLGWSPARLSNYENDLRTPSLIDSRKIVAALKRHGVECGLDDVFPTESSNDETAVEDAA